METIIKLITTKSEITDWSITAVLFYRTPEEKELNKVSVEYIDTNTGYNISESVDCDTLVFKSLVEKLHQFIKDNDLWLWSY